MKFGRIPKRALDIQLGETYDGPYTLRDELLQVGEDIISSKCILAKRKGSMDIVHFLAWTEHYTMTLVNSCFGDWMIVALPRNPIKQKGK